MAFRQSRTMQRNKNGVRFNARKNGLGPISNTLVLALILSLMGLLYLTQITKTTTFGYQVNELETQRSALLERQQTLEVESARLQALERIQQSEVARELTTPEQTDFIR